MINKNNYIAPELYVELCAVEEGIAVSENNWGYPGEDPEFNDYGEF